MKLCLAALALVLLSSLVFSQRDYFTDEEVELIRDAQQIDKRVDVEVHAIDRRFAVLNVNVNAPAFKEKGDWGAAPAGSRLDLLQDIKHILQKSIDDIDNLYARPDSVVVDPEEQKKKPKSVGQLLNTAVRNMAAAAQRYQPALKAELDKNTNDAEKGSILDALEMCDEIIAAAGKLQPSAAGPAKTKN
jgi:hypothetical protein